MDKVKLIKLLNLTTSSNDHEALNAMRAANRLVETGNQTWETVISVIAKKEEFKAKAYHYEGDFNSDHFDNIFRQAQNKTPNVKEMLDVCMANVTGDGLDFIESLSSFFRQNGFLSPKQMTALKKFYRNCDK